MIGINYSHCWSSDELNDALDNWAPITKRQHCGLCVKWAPLARPVSDWLLCAFSFLCIQQDPNSPH